MTLASLSFLSPLWAWGFLAAVGAPLLAHLLSRRGGVVATFPAARFVQQAVTDTARLLRPRHWLLLLLRTLALALVVLAFMQPVWTRQVEAALPDDRGLHLALIVDRTASMQRTAGGATLLDEARRLALARLGQLDPTRDRASVILLDRQPTSLLPEPSANLTGLTDRLQQVAPTWHHGRYDDAVRLALDLARRAADDQPRTTRIEMFTDAQRTQGDRAALAALVGDAATVHWHTIGTFAGNTALMTPAVVPTRPIAGQPALVSVEVAHFGDEPADVAVVLRTDAGTDGGEGDSNPRAADPVQRLRLGPFGRTTVTFPVTFDRAGTTVIEFTRRGPSDALAADDRTGRVIEVLPARPVRLITRGDTANPRAATWFIARALAPDTAGTSASVALTVSPPDVLADLPLPTGGEVIVLAEAGRLDEAALRALGRQLQGGAGVVWVIDSPHAAASLGAFADVTGEPAAIVPAPTAAWADGAVRSPAVGRFDDPVLGVFEGPARAGLLRAQFNATLLGAAPPSAETLLTLDDGRPMLALRWHGAGRLAVLGVSLDPSDTDFAKGPQLVPLLHQLLRHLSPGPPAEPNARPGDGLTLDGPVMGPDGTVVSDATPRATVPGLYAVRNDDGTLRAGRWVELDPAESDLRVMGDGDEGDADVTVATAASPSAPAPPALRPEAIELWPWLVFAALVMLAVEGAALLAMSRGATGVEPGRLTPPSRTEGAHAA